MTDFTLGVLLPSSSILPMAKRFKSGLKRAAKEVGIEQMELEFIGNGNPRLVEEVMRKMTEFHEVDAITGIVSNQTLAFCSKVFESAGVPIVVNNLGGHLPELKDLPNNVFINSDHIWQQMWSLGYWGTEKFGSKGMLVGGVYDMAYNFTKAMDLGMKKANPDSKWSLAVTRLPQGVDNLSDPSVVLDYIEKDSPDFLIAAFCGEEARLFMEGFINRKLHQKVPLLGLPYLLRDLSFEPEEAFKVYSTTLTMGASQPQEVNWFNGDVFEALGYESGVLLGASRDGGGVLQLSGIEINSSRGSFVPSKALRGEESVIHLVEHLYKGKVASTQSTLGRQLRTAALHELNIPHSNMVDSGWFNPYLGL